MSSFRPPPVWLLPLVLAAFTVQTDDFIIIGVLPSIASSVRVSEAAAGQLVTVYSLVYALTAPLWAFLLARTPRRPALLWSLAVFTAANAAVVFVDGYLALLVLRVVAALAAAVVLPTCLAIAGTRAPSGHRGRYLATVMTGLTGAVLIGVPLGTWIGALVDWRATFAFAALLGLACLGMAARSLPVSPASTGEERQSPAGLLRALADRAVAAVLAITVLTVAGNLAFQTYIAPVLSGISGTTPALLALLLVCAGVGALVGTQVSGRMVDRAGALGTFLCAGAVFCSTMAAMALLWRVAPVPVWALVPLLMLWSAAAWAVPPSLQTLMLDRAGERAASQAVAVHSSSVHVGAALGAVLGGAAVALSPGLVPAAAAVVAGLGLLLGALVRRVPDRAGT